MPVRVPRDYVLGEIRYGIYFANKYYPGKRCETEFVLGVHPLIRKYPPELHEIVEEYRGAYAVADLCIWEDDHVVIVEAKLRAAKGPEAWARLRRYRDLVPISIRLLEAGIRKADFILVSPVEDPLVARECYREGFRYVVDMPPFYQEVMRKYAPTYKDVPEYQLRLAKLLEKIQ